MSDDMEGKLHDPEKGEGHEEDEEEGEEEEEELERQMGEVDGEETEKLDEQMWGSDEEEEQDSEVHVVDNILTCVLALNCLKTCNIQDAQSSNLGAILNFINLLASFVFSVLGKKE